MTENPRLAAFLNLISRTQEQTSLVAGADRLVGTFAQAALQAMQAKLSDEEMQLAAIIGHFKGCKDENTLPDYLIVLAQLEYWQAVYLEVAQFWLDRST